MYTDPSIGSIPLFAPLTLMKKLIAKNISKDYMTYSLN